MRAGSRSSTRRASIPSSARAPRSATGDPGGDEVARALAADPQPEQQPAAGDVVEGRGLLGDEARVPERKEHDARSEHDSPRDGRERRERDAEIEDRVVEREVLAGPDRVVTQLLGELGDGPVSARVGELGRKLAASLDPDSHRPDATESRVAFHAFS